MVKVGNKAWLRVADRSESGVVHARLARGIAAACQQPPTSAWFRLADYSFILFRILYGKKQ